MIIAGFGIFCMAVGSYVYCHPGCLDGLIALLG